MMLQTEMMEISKVRGILERVVREEPIPLDMAQVARHTVQTMCQEAAAHGLTTADVLRAVLHPVFEERRSCGCSGCKARQNELVEEKPMYMSTPVAW